MCLLESVALGKPFVSTKIGGASELLNGYTCGYSIETDEEAARAICAIINTDKKHMANECEHSIRRFEFKSYIEKIEYLIDSVVKKD